MLQVKQSIKTKKEARKDLVYKRTQEYFTTYKNFMIVDMTNISSSQHQKIRYFLRGKGEFLMGRNTTIKHALKAIVDRHPEMKEVDSVIKNNVGFVFTNSFLGEICEVFEKTKIDAVAKPGNFAQCDVWIEPVQTGMDPGKTVFFQALGIPTKITKGSIEILSRYKALTKGKRIGHSEAMLLSVLGITPFVYKMEVVYAYSDGKFFDKEYLKISSEDMCSLLKDEVSTLSMLALGAGYVTESTVVLELQVAARNIMALAAGAGYNMSELSSLLKQ